MALFDFVQAKSAANLSGASVSATFDSPVSTGNIVFVYGVCYADITSVTDSQSNGYAFGGGEVNVGPYYALNVTGGSSFQVTVAATGAAQCTINIVEFVGDSSVVFDTFNAVPYDATPTNSINSGNISTANAVELLVGTTLIGTLAGGTLITSAESGFIQRVNFFNGDYFRHYIHTQVTSASGTYDWSAGFGANSVGTTAAIHAFKSGGGGTTWPGYIAPFGWN